jgi:D-alanyl-lipoteichoic acid acyltransferase DltB (MBOAT superfamily)
MLFNSYEFLFLFLPIVLIVFSAIGIRGHHRVTITWLVAASLFFYGWWNLAYLGLIVFSMFFNYAIGVALSSDVNNRKRLKLIFGVAANLGLLGYFKYANFFVSNLNALAYHGVLAPNHRWRGLVTPASTLNCRVSRYDVLGPATQASLQYRYRGLRSLRWIGKGHRLY